MKKSALATKTNTSHATTPQKCADSLKTPHDHIHAVNCGHKSYVHAGHVCYEHDGHYHYMHGDHAHACAGPFAKQTAPTAKTNTANEKNWKNNPTPNNVVPINRPTNATAAHKGVKRGK
jgi:hypothetical protein